MIKFLIALSLVLSGSAIAQDACLIDEKPHYFVAEGTTKTPLTNELRANLTPDQQAVWTNSFRTFGIVSAIHNDLAACNDALELLTAQRNIPRKDPIHAVQSLSYQGRCIATVICP